MNSTCTKSGKYTIFHRENCPFAKPGARIPTEYEDGRFNKGPWFFQPTENWTTAVGSIRGYPLNYSPGFATIEEALEEAERWEMGEEARVRQEDAAFSALEQAPTFKL